MKISHRPEVLQRETLPKKKCSCTVESRKATHKLRPIMKFPSLPPSWKSKRCHWNCNFQTVPEREREKIDKITPIDIKEFLKVCCERDCEPQKQELSAAGHMFMFTFSHKHHQNIPYDAAREPERILYQHITKVNKENLTKHFPSILYFHQKKKNSKIFTNFSH